MLGWHRDLWMAGKSGAASLRDLARDVGRIADSLALLALIEAERGPFPPGAAVDTLLARIRTGVPDG